MQVARELLVAYGRSCVVWAVIGPGVVIVQPGKIFCVHANPLRAGVECACSERNRFKCADVRAIVRAIEPASGKTLRRTGNCHPGHRCNTLRPREKSRPRDWHISSRTLESGRW